MKQVWRCTRCQRQPWVGTVMRGIAVRYGTGKCACGGRSFYLHDEPDEGEAAKTYGMALAKAVGIDAAWHAAAEQCARGLAQSGVVFTQDEVTDQVGLPTHRNATGSLLAGLARRGVIIRVGDVKGSRASQHARRISQWKGA